jgi:acyl-ACP thioesterase
MTMFAPDPVAGRIYLTERTVRATDVTSGGRLRLDAIARYLQDAAADDVASASWNEPAGWLLRKCELAIAGYPAYRDQVRLRTFCSATGPRWAERTTTLSGACGDLIQARAVWVAIGRDTGAPAALGEEFLRVYGPSARGRTASVRLVHRRPGPAWAERAWPLRACDFDTAGHVNNTVAWAAVEDALAGLGWVPASAEIEYHRPILPGCEPRLLVHLSPAQLRTWLIAGASQHTERLVSAIAAR